MRVGFSPTVVMRHVYACRVQCFVTLDFTGKRGRYFRLMILAVANSDNVIKSPFAVGAALITSRHCHKLLIDQDIDFSSLYKILFSVGTSILAFRWSWMLFFHLLFILEIFIMIRNLLLWMPYSGLVFKSC